MEFPKYVGLGSSENPNSCLFLEFVSHGKESVATYSRPRETGDWDCEASIIDGRIIISACEGIHLYGKELFPVSREQFLTDNPCVNPKKYMKKVSIQEYNSMGLELEKIDVSTVSTLLFKEGDVTSIKWGGINATGNSVVIEGTFRGEWHKDITYDFNAWCKIPL